MSKNNVKNVLGEPLSACCDKPKTGYFRDGYCRTDNHDRGKHLICAVMTDEFLQFSFQKGNDLISANLEFGFPGLKAGDGWCLCVSRWIEAYRVNVAPPVDLNATHEYALKYLSIDVLKAHAVVNH